MIETAELVRQLCSTVKSLVGDGQPFFGQVISLGRKLRDGQIQIIGTEEYAGPDASRAPYAYVRFRDGAREHNFQAAKQTTAEPGIEVTAALRMVVVHRCENEAALQTAVLSALLASASRNGFLWKIIPRSASGRGQTVQREETQGDRSEKEDGKPGQDFMEEAKLMAIDFDMVYTMAAGEAACKFTCDGCC